LFDAALPFFINLFFLRPDRLSNGKRWSSGPVADLRVGSPPLLFSSFFSPSIRPMCACFLAPIKLCFFIRVFHVSPLVLFCGHVVFPIFPFFTRSLFGWPQRPNIVTFHAMHGSRLRPSRKREQAQLQIFFYPCAPQYTRCQLNLKVGSNDRHKSPFSTTKRRLRMYMRFDSVVLDDRPCQYLCTWAVPPSDSNAYFSTGSRTDFDQLPNYPQRVVSRYPWLT